MSAEAAKSNSSVKKLTRRPKKVPEPSENSSAPEANLSKDLLASESISRQSAAASSQNEAPSAFNSYNESYLNSSRNSTPLNYEYPSAQDAQDLDSQMKDLEQLYSTISNESESNQLSPKTAQFIPLTSKQQIEQSYQSLEKSVSNVAKIINIIESEGTPAQNSKFTDNNASSNGIKNSIERFDNMMRNNNNNQIERDSFSPADSDCTNSENQAFNSRNSDTSNEESAEESAQKSFELSVPSQVSVLEPAPPLVEMYNNASNAITDVKTSVLPHNSAKNNYTHSDASYNAQEEIIEKLEEECNTLKKPSVPKEELQYNIEFELNQKENELQALKQEFSELRSEFIQLNRENEEMRAFFEELIAELHGEDVEISFDELKGEVLELIQRSQTEVNSQPSAVFYEQRIEEAVVDLEAMKRLLNEKDKEMEQLRKNQMLQNSKDNNQLNVTTEISKRDKTISAELTEIEELQAELFELKSAPKNDSSKSQIEELEELLELANVREEELEKQEFENEKSYEQFADQRIETIRNGLQDEIQKLMNQNSELEIENENVKMEKQNLQNKLDVIEESVKDDRISKLENELKEEPLSNQLMERAVFAEKKLKDYELEYEEKMTEKSNLLKDYEEELGEIIAELEELL